jgi:hypothetical protein
MGGRGQTGRHGLGVLVAGLPEVRVQVDEPRRDDDATRVDVGSLVSLQPGHRSQDTLAHDDLSGSFPPRRRINEPGSGDLQVRHGFGESAGDTPASR